MLNNGWEKLYFGPACWKKRRYEQEEWEGWKHGMDEPHGASRGTQTERTVNVGISIGSSAATES